MGKKKKTEISCFPSVFSIMAAEKGKSLLDTGHARLNELGYKQELKRDLS